MLVSQGDFGKDGGKTISKAIENVIDAGVIPVINENDAVNSGGAKFFHDNDDLASQLGTLLGAEVLVMLSNVDGVIDKDANAVIPVVYDADAALENEYGTCNGLGGLKAKIKAAKAFVQNGGKAAIIASGRTAGGGLPISFRDGATCTIFPSKELTAELLAGQVKSAKSTSKEIARIVAKKGGSAIATALRGIALSLEKNAEKIANANGEDAKKGEEKISKAMLHRLSFDKAAVEKTAEKIRKLAAFPDPLAFSEKMTGTNGKISVTKKARPLGLVGIIFESRPDVTAEAAAVALKAGNAVVLKGGKEAANTNKAIVNAISEGLQLSGFPKDAVELLEGPSDIAFEAMVGAEGLIDLLIARGGAGLISAVKGKSRVPFIESGIGSNAIYLDESAKIGDTIPVVINAKMQKPVACNSICKLLVHEKIAQAALPRIAQALEQKGAEIVGCKIAAKIIGCARVIDADWTEDFSKNKIAVKVVSSSDEAIDFINANGSHHSDGIITESRAEAEKFKAGVESAAVYVNCSTRFTDGGEFGLGGELGISTQKLHACGPIGPEQLVTHYYEVVGNYSARG